MSARTAGACALAAAALWAGGGAAAQRMDTLDNGLRIVEVDRPGLPLLFAGLFVDRGSDADPPGREGLVQLLCSLLWAGSDALDEEGVLRELEACGAVHGAQAGVEHAVVWVQSLASRFPRALELLHGAATGPALAGAVFDRKRRETQAALRKRQEDPAWLAGVRFGRELLGDHPYGRPVDGKEGSLAALTRDEAAAFHPRLFRPERAVLFLVGPLGEAERHLARELWGRWSPKEAEPLPDPLPPPPEVPPQRRVVFVDRPGVTQAYLRIGARSPARADTRRHALEILDMAMAGGFTSVLVDDLRVSKGLIYSVGVRREFLSAPSAWAVATSTRAETTAQTIQGVLDGLALVRGGGVEGRLLATARNLLVGQFPARLEDPASLSGFLFRALRDGKGLDAHRAYPDRVAAVAPEELAAAAATFAPERVLIVVVGDRRQVDVEALGRFEAGGEGGAQGTGGGR